jgi:hypothetical protein
VPAWARKRDANEPEIVEALVKFLHASVTRLTGKGEPDLLVGYLGRTWLLEVKAPLGAKGGLPAYRDGIGGRGDLQPDQVKWWDDWKGEAPRIVRSSVEAIRIIAGEAMATLYAERIEAAG